MSVTQEWDVATEDGFLTCYRATFREIYGYAGLLAGHDRAAAEDLVHDVYTHTLHRARRGEMEAVSYGYLRTAVRHRWIDRWRSAERERARLGRAAAGTGVGAGAGAGTAWPVEAEHDVADMLADLPERERTVMVLRYVDDLTMAAIGERLGVSESTIDGLIRRALQRLRLTQEGADHA